MSRDVPDGWEVKSLKTMINLTTGFPFKSNQFNDDAETGTPVVRIRDLTAQSPSIFTAEPFEMRYLVKHGDYLIGMDGEFSAIKWEGLDAALNQRVLKLSSSSSELDSEFLYYRIQPELTMIHGRTGATTVKHLSTKDLLSLEISLPPLYEQHRIAEILSSVDDAIAATQAVIEQTKTVKQATLERLLTRGIGHTRFKQTTIGEIPEAWQLGRVDDFFVLQRGFDITEKQSLFGDYPVISSSGFSYFHSESKIEGPAVITGRKGKLGQVYFIETPCWPHDTTLWVKNFKNNNPKYIYWFLTSLNLEKFDAATAVPTLNRNVVHAQICAFPSLNEQVQIVERLDTLAGTVKTQNEHLNYLYRLKSALMSDLLAGRKRVTDTLPLAAE